MWGELRISLAVSGLVVNPEPTGLVVSHNFHANFVKNLEACKHLPQDLVNNEEKKTLLFHDTQNKLKMAHLLTIRQQPQFLSEIDRCKEKFY